MQSVPNLLGFICFKSFKCCSYVLFDSIFSIYLCLLLTAQTVCLLLFRMQLATAVCETRAHN